MGEEQLALGQREVVADGTHLFTEEEVKLMADAGTSPDEVLEFVKTSGVQTLNAAIGGVQALKKNEGQERNEPFQSQEEADAEVSSSPEAKEQAAEVEASKLPETETTPE